MLEALAHACSGIEIVSQAVADEIEGEDAERECDGREEHQVGRLKEVRTGIVEHGSPGRSGGLDTEAEKAQRGFGEYRSGHPYSGLYQEGLQNVGQDVAKHQMQIAGTQRSSRLNVFALLYAEHLGSHQACVVDPSGKSEGKDEVREAGSEKRDDGDREKDSRKSKEGVSEIDVDDRIGEASVESGQHAEGNAQGKGERDDGGGYDERDSRSIERSRKYVAAKFIGAKPVGGRGGKKPCTEVQMRRVVGGQPGSEEGAKQKECEHQAAGKSEAMLRELTQYGAES